MGGSFWPYDAFLLLHAPHVGWCSVGQIHRSLVYASKVQRKELRQQSHATFMVFLKVVTCLKALSVLAVKWVLRYRIVTSCYADIVKLACLGDHQQYRSSLDSSLWHLLQDRLGLLEAQVKQLTEEKQELAAEKAALAGQNAVLSQVTKHFTVFNPPSAASHSFGSMLIILPPHYPNQALFYCRAFTFMRMMWPSKTAMALSLVLRVSKLALCVRFLTIWGLNLYWCQCSHWGAYHIWVS